MSISEEDIENFKNKYKSLLYDQIANFASKQTDFIAQIDKIGQYINIDTDIPNMGISFNHKLNELSRIFKKSGISIFVEFDEKYDLVTPNFVGNAIIEEMLSYISKGIKTLSDYDFVIEKLVKAKNERTRMLEESGPIKKIFFKIRSFFIPSTVSNITSYSEKEIEDANEILSDYKEIDEDLRNYNLKDNVVQSLVNFINERQYHDFDISKLIEENVIPTLQKLKLEDVIPELYEEISKSREQMIFSKNKSWELSPTQRLEIQMSTKKVANEVEQNENNVISKKDKEYND